MPSNDFLVFGGGSDANVLSQADWATLAQRLSGFQSGVAQSAQLNKAWRQSSVMAAVLAQFIAANSGQDARDDGTTETLLANLGLAFQAYSAGHTGHGRCRLSVVNANTLKLSPRNGNMLLIGGIPRRIPAAGLTISNSGCAVYTVYYVYAYMGGNDPALELDTKAHATDPDTGVEVKIGDASRTLVGMVSTVPGGNTFADTSPYRLCLNWFQQRVRAGCQVATGQTNFSNVAQGEIHTGMRVYFLTWAGGAVSAGVHGHLTNSSASNSTSVYSFVDGAIWGAGTGAYVSLAGAGTEFISRNADERLAEGVHMAQVYGAVTGDGGTALSLVNEVTTWG